ncbi:cytidylyltransferase domain-containing protein [Nitrosopumilus adriaticus]|uniref:acylneuraminate cytidylyltransferase family protein n=1 Tax=Nitrosopumilus adriaticus TaxID=1580092 RepID=UPI00352F8407
MKPICFIAARGGSKGVKRKNIRIFAGKPLIAHSIESAKKSGIFSHIIVSTEDKEIGEISKQFGAEVPFKRPKKLASDHAAMRDVMIHGIESLYSLGYEFEEFVSRDCTAPFIRHKDILGSLKLLRKEKSNAVFGVYKQHYNPYFNMMETNKNGFLKMSKKLDERPVSRQLAPTVFQLNGFFTYNAKKFLKFKEPIRIPKVLPYIIPEETGWMIDTEVQFSIAEAMLKKGIVKIS